MRDFFRGSGLGAERLPGVPHQKGDFIGQKYQVFGALGKGGFGVVYLVYSHETKSVLALKTFRDEYLQDKETRERFRKEAQVWADLERHPYLVRAYFVDEVVGRLYIAMEYIAPDESGLNSLDGYLQRRIDAQHHAEPERPRAALLGTRAALRRGARLAWALRL